MIISSVSSSKQLSFNSQSCKGISSISSEESFDASVQPESNIDITINNEIRVFLLGHINTSRPIYTKNHCLESWLIFYGNNVLLFP